MKKGFTLIELLAVIVIIAIIALITIPLIGRVIENSKKGALTASASGIIEAAEIYYSTKMMENPETKTFMCSSEGCINGEEKLDYKGQVSEGRVILYADGKVSICIEDGTNAALKLAEQSEITTEEGSCNYESEDYSIDATVSKTKYNEALVELDKWKKGIAQSITNKGIETSETSSLEEMQANIEQIATGDLEKSKLIEALKYSGLGLTEDSTADEIYETLAKQYPEILYVDLSTIGFSKSANVGATTTMSQSTNRIVFSGSGLNAPAAVVHDFESTSLDMTKYKTLKVKFTVAGNVQTADIYKLRLMIGGIYTEYFDNGTYVEEIDISNNVNNLLKFYFYTASTDYTTTITVTEITLSA